MITKDRIVSNDIHIPFEYHENTPDNPVVVMFAGILKTLAAWVFILRNKEFSENYNLLIFAYRGQAEATKYKHDDEVFTVQENTKYLNEILVKLNLINKKLHLVSVSNGGALIYDFALKYPDNVASTLFFGPLFYFDTPLYNRRKAFINIGKDPNHMLNFWDLNHYGLYSEYFYLKAEKKVKMFRELILENLEDDPKLFPAMIKQLECYMEYFQSIKDSLHLFKNLSFPKKIIGGEKDDTVSSTLLQNVAELIGAEYQEIKNAGHLLEQEEPELFISNIMYFVDKSINPTRDNRKTGRIALQLPGEIRFASNEIYTGQCLDWSAKDNKGCLFEITDKNAVLNKLMDTIGKEVSLYFFGPDNAVYTGSIVWVKSQSIFIHVGIKYLKHIKA